MWRFKTFGWWPRLLRPGFLIRSLNITFETTITVFISISVSDILLNLFWFLRVFNINLHLLPILVCCIHDNFLQVSIFRDISCFLSSYIHWVPISYYGIYHIWNIHNASFHHLRVFCTSKFILFAPLKTIYQYSGNFYCKMNSMKKVFFQSKGSDKINF